MNEWNLYKKETIKEITECWSLLTKKDKSVAFDRTDKMSKIKYNPENETRKALF